MTRPAGHPGTDRCRHPRRPGRPGAERRGAGPDRRAGRPVFDRFHRVDHARGRTLDGGVGLGPSIVHSPVSAHHGRMEVDAAPGRGATFRMVLPLHPDSPTAGS
ncbi:ATP-binding protein [Streptomyces sp. NPDC018955]|uniref:ATP-binding protein n=1 Tax=Streptomyces sp. NPDC018955 TaxID=3365055 RepID=UPI00378B1DBE